MRPWTLRLWVGFRGRSRRVRCPCAWSRAAIAGKVSPASRHRVVSSASSTEAAPRRSALAPLTAGYYPGDPMVAVAERRCSRTEWTAFRPAPDAAEDHARSMGAEECGLPRGASWDRSGLDDRERETIHSIRARAPADALAGRPPCPIWGDHGPERGRG